LGLALAVAEAALLAAVDGAEAAGVVAETTGAELELVGVLECFCSANSHTHANTRKTATTI
jgi:hypothetical protein